MSRRHRLMRRRFAVTALIAACCASAPSLVGCSAGQITQTDSQVAAVDGAFADVGDSIALRDVLIPAPPNSNGTYPAGSSVPVLLTIINQGTRADRLIAVTSPVASQVLVLGTTTIPPGTNVTSTAGSASAGVQSQSPLVVGQLRIVLSTTQPLRAGLNTPVTFVFENAGSVTLPVPMAVPVESVSEVNVVESGEHSGDEHSGGHG
ncbi:MAG TPA: copper chaperone PCu(A)C [Pseudonocardiaceae bacterium]|nr:copper chaperone PCu(A)C [Pseudonocardiaceae bacterium]